MASSSSSSSNLLEARSLTHNANVHLSSSSHSLAFPLYLKAAELYSLLVRQVTDPSEKKKIRAEFAEVLRIADGVKKVLKAKEGEGGVRSEGGKGRCDPGERFELIRFGAREVRPSRIGREFS